MKQTKTFQSYRTKETFQIFHNLKCNRENLIYLLQCRICQLQCVGKSETPFNIRLRKDAKSQASILACINFNEQNHNFQQHAEFTLIEQIKKQTTTEETRTFREAKIYGRENLWVLKLKALYPDGLNQELNNID